MKWYFCLNDGDWQFEMAQVAVCSARKNTTFEPICIYDGCNKRVIDWMTLQNIPIIFHRSNLYEKACQVYGVPPNSLRSVKPTGAWLRIDIPLLTNEDFILYTDTDIMFLGDCKELENIKPKYIAAVNDYNPLNDYNINSGVLLMNVKNLRAEHEDFIKFININMLKTWATYDQNAYDIYYANRILKLPLEFNWKSFWEEDYAIWLTDIRVQRTKPIQILHFTGTKPWDETKYKEGMGIFRNSNNCIWKKKWSKFYEEVKLPEKEEIPITKYNNLYPYYTFLNMTNVNSPKLLEELIIDFGVNIIDMPNEYPEYIKTYKPKLDMRIWQQPNQLAAFLSWIHSKRLEINNYTEIGIAYGGTFYIIDSYLRAINPNFTYSTGVDCIPKPHDSYNYLTKFTETKIIQSKSLNYIPDKPIDLCLIDTIHTYEQVKKEYELFKNYCKYIAFHDVASQNFSEMRIPIESTSEYC